MRPLTLRIIQDHNHNSRLKYIFEKNMRQIKGLKWPKMVPKLQFLHFHCKVGHVTPYFDGNELQRKNVLLKTDFDKNWNDKNRNRQQNAKNT